MMNLSIATLLTLTALVPLAQDDPAAPAPIPPIVTPEAPRIEVVFALDTTGSMSGLIEGAKAKIWSIANRIATGKPAPELKLGLVAYRDRGDDYVTRKFDLSADLDAVYAELTSYSAGGGGDGPEHVNAALHDAVSAMGWSASDRVLKIVFLVGDAPPHMDYDDGKDYREICKGAVQGGIIVNTIRCGGDPVTEKFWRDIARLSEGTFTTIEQSGGMAAVATPLDARLAELNGLLAGTTVAYGSAETRREAEKKCDAVARMPAAAAADRAEFLGRRDGHVGDLLDALNEGRVQLADLKPEELPDGFKDLTPEELRGKLDETAAKRKEITAEINRLSAERRAWLEEEMKQAAGAEDSFDAKVLKVVKEQAKRKGIEY